MNESAFSSDFDWVSIGSGHNALTTAAYLAKAGKRVLVLEANEWWGGGVVTRELTAPGFLHDQHAGNHLLIQANPLIRHDELQLLSEFGLSYVEADTAFAAIFDDGTSLGIYRDRARTLASIGAISPQDAAAFDRFADLAVGAFSAGAAGLFAPPVPQSVMTAAMEQDEFGRLMMVLSQRSVLDVVNDWFSHDKVKAVLLKLAAELTLAHPREKTVGASLLMVIALLETYGAQVPVGGSGRLSDALVRSIQARGGEVRVGVEVTGVLRDGAKVVGVRDANGTEYRAQEGVIGTIHPHHLGKWFPDLPAGLLRKAAAVELSPLSLFMIHAAMPEPIDYSAGAEANGAIMSAVLSSRLSDLLDGFDDLYRGVLPTSPMSGASSPTLFDPSRAPEGKHTLHVSTLSRYRLGGDPANWAARKQSYAAELLTLLQKYAPGLDPDRFYGQFVLAPTDHPEDSPSFVDGDTHAIASWGYQSGALRPIPELAQYTIPGIDGFYLSGPAQHPGPGASGGGRAVAVKILSDQGNDLTDVIGS